MSDPPSPPAPPGRLRRLAEPFWQQLRQGADPRRIALALALGSAISLFPVFGTTALLCLLAGLALGLNQPILQAVNAACNLIWAPALFGFVRLGDRCAGPAAGGPALAALPALLRSHPADFLRTCGATLLHAVLGWAIVIPFWIPLVYFVSLPLLRAGARPRRAAAAARRPVRA
jgi:Uncharacterized protein conserved in bacteria (DUF2062)